MKKDFPSRMTTGLDFPGTALCNTPMGTFHGKGEFTLENHSGILIYEKDHIHIAVKRGTVVVRGRDLTIANMTPGYLRIKGIITMIELE